MSSKDYLSLGSGTILYLLGMFGGGLIASEPPLHPLHPNSVFAPTVAKFSALFLLILISAIVKLWHPNRGQKLWIVVAVFGFIAFLASSWSYSRSMTRYSFEYPAPNNVMVFAAGLEYSPRADSIVQANPGITKPELLSGFGGLAFAARVWPESSLDKSRKGFEWRYILLLCSLSTALFALIEGILAPRKKLKAKPPPDPAPASTPRGQGP